MGKVLVLGYGISGKASAALLRKMRKEVVIVDRKGEGEALVDSADFPLDGIEQVVLSPGISPEHPIVRRAHQNGIEVIGEIELAFRLVKNRCVGVTGTNGKTTVTLLVAHILNGVGRKARAVGNVGEALSEYLLAADENEILVVELSSYQLETLRQKRLEAAVFLNLTPDHFERYPDLRAYGEAKARIQDCLLPGGKLFVSNELMREFSDLFHIPVEVFDFKESIASISNLEYIKLGVPEEQNVQAAFALCKSLGVTQVDFERELKTFRKPAHRIEWVAESNGVSYYNDSKGTNIDAVLHAMALFEAPVVLLVGGVDKGASYLPWVKGFQHKIRKMVAYGEAASKIEAELQSYFPFKRVKTLDEAVRIAKEEAKSGEVVLLSPGCSSYDQFRNYAHRGDEFKRLVKETI